jgi:peptidyl-prolyl cis-trans isomerase D
MTMLDRMRRHKNWLKWSLALVVLTFVAFYIPSFLNVNGGAAPSHETVAEVDGRKITYAEFIRVYNTQLQAYRNAYGGSMNESLLKQLGIDRQILQQLIDERAALAEAERLGIGATDAEVRERIVRMPGLQENGQFIGEQRYRQLLQMQRPPVSPAEFEDSLRRSIVLEKLRTALTGWMNLSDAEVDREYRHRNEKIKAQVVTFTADRFREGVQASDQELAQYFEGHKEQFRVGEKRKIRFIAVDPQKIRERVNVSPQDAERYYNQNVEQYSTPEQIRASHILLKTEGKDEATVRKRAEEVLARVRAGEDFATLAREYSEDEASKDRGGDLDFFPRGRMVPEFDQVAFSMQPGITSDLVKTQYGFHIIKVTDRRAPTQRPFEEVKDQIVEQLKFERAQTLASDTVNRMATEIDDPSDFERVARANGLTVQESGFFERDEPIAALGPSPEAAAQAFTLEEGKVSEPVRAGQGYVILTVTGRQAARLPTLDEVKDRVREAVVSKKALDAARAKAESVVATLKSAPDFEAAAKAAGLDVQSTSDFVARDATLPGIGSSPAAERVAFSLKPGEVSDLIATDNAIAIVKVVERQDVTDTQVAEGRAALRVEMLNERRSRFFSSYMGKAKERMRITVNREALQRLSA